MKNRIMIIRAAGNTSAIVRGNITDKGERRAIAEQLLSEGRAEQVGFEAVPIHGGDCRLEMAGGEFCANSLRAAAMMYVSERYDGGFYQLRVEISGTEEPVPVAVDLDAGQAFASMPLVREMHRQTVKGKVYPLVCMDGADHLIVEDCMDSEGMKIFASQALEAMNAQKKECCGVMFLNGDQLTPFMYVRETDSLVWESSCGSGSIAAAWYLAAKSLDLCENGEVRYLFHEPGGDLQVVLTVEDRKIIRVLMGGTVEIE